MKLPLLAFEISRRLEPSQKLVLACSGGLDSVVLVDLFAQLRERKNLDLSLAHIHHGPSLEGDVLFRDQAQLFVETLAEKYGLPIYVRTSVESLRSEADLREFRQNSFREILQTSGAERVVLAHHADDLLETRLIRLIRGTGPQGLIAMTAKTKTTLRPLLGTTRAQLETYARDRELSHIEDPSNRELTPLRNWIRHHWLPQLETKRPGSVNALGRSLDLLAETQEIDSSGVADLGTTPSLGVENQTKTQTSRPDFHRLPEALQRKTIAEFARTHDAKDFGQSRIIEVLKRLKRLGFRRQKTAQFQVGGLTWVVTPHEITAVRAQRLDARRP